MEQKNNNYEMLCDQLDGLIRVVAPSVGGARAVLSMIAEADEADRPKLAERYFKRAKIGVSAERRTNIDELSDRFGLYSFMGPKSEELYGRLNELIDRRPGEEEFYKEVWKLIDSEDYSTDEKCVAMFLVTDCHRIPYYFIDIDSEPEASADMIMEYVNENADGIIGRFKSIIDDDKSAVVKRASAVNRLFKEIKDDDSRIAFFTWFTAYFSSTSMPIDMQSLWNATVERSRGELPFGSEDPDEFIDDLDDDIDGLFDDCEESGKCADPFVI